MTWLWVLLLATINYTGFETGDFSECLGSTGTCSIQSSTKRTGVYALRSNPTTTGTGYVQIGGYSSGGGMLATSASVATSYIRFYFRVATRPAAGSEPLFALFDGTTNLKAQLALNSSGNLVLLDSGSSVVTTGASVLSTGTWYRIEIKIGTGAGSSAYEVLIDGVSEISGTASFGSSNAGYCTLGKNSNFGNRTVDFFFDDFRWSDSAYPGAGECHIQKPAANGHYTAWTGVGGASKWQDVNVVPPDGDTAYIHDAGNGDAYSATVDSTTTAGISGTINSQKTVVVAKSTTPGNASILSVRTRSGTTDSDTDGSPSGQTTDPYTGFGLIRDTDPATSAAWSTSALDAIEVGIVNSDLMSASINCTAIYSMVDCTPAAAPTFKAPPCQVARDLAPVVTDEFP